MPEGERTAIAATLGRWAWVNARMHRPYLKRKGGRLREVKIREQVTQPKCTHRPPYVSGY